MQMLLYHKPQNVIRAVPSEDTYWQKLLTLTLKNLAFFLCIRVYYGRNFRKYEVEKKSKIKISRNTISKKSTVLWEKNETVLKYMQYS